LFLFAEIMAETVEMATVDGWPIFHRFGLLSERAGERPPEGILESDFGMKLDCPVEVDPLGS
jgi:hypothetical protein